jgi:predicted nucleotide-binding protein
MTYPPPFDDPKQIVLALAQQETVCSDAVAETISGIGELKVFAKGEVIASQGEVGEDLFYIMSGAVTVVINEHEYRVRKRGEMIGEMAVMEPGQRRSADLIAAEPQTMLFVVPATAFHKAAQEHGAIWECIARVLSSRLRQRDEMFVPPNPKPVVFIASSSEGSDVVAKAQIRLQASDRELKPWNQPGIFRPTLNTLEELERHAHEVDFVVIVVTADDIRDSRGKVAFVPRDNVLLEFGLFMGGLERQRVFLLASKDADLALASDLSGVTVLYYSDDSELADRLSEIDQTIRRLGRIFRYCKVL